MDLQPCPYLVQLCAGPAARMSLAITYLHRNGSTHTYDCC